MRYFDAGQTSANGVTVAKPVELKYPLWWSNGTTQSTSNALSSKAMMRDGTTLAAYNGTDTSQQLHTLSANWPSGTQFSFEATIYSNNASYTAYAQLWDMTNNVGTGLTVSTTSTTAITVRSVQGALTPGHVYGVAVYAGTSGACYICDASLIIYPA